MVEVLMPTCLSTSQERDAQHLVASHGELQTKADACLYPL